MTVFVKEVVASKFLHDHRTSLLTRRIRGLSAAIACAIQALLLRQLLPMFLTNVTNPKIFIFNFSLGD
jgi:hypothetical protein